MQTIKEQQPTKTILHILIPLSNTELIREGIKTIQKKLNQFGKVRMPGAEEEGYVNIDVELLPNEDQTTDHIIHQQEQVHLIIPSQGKNTLDVELGVTRFNDEDDILQVHRDTDIWVDVDDIPDGEGDMYLTY